MESSTETIQLRARTAIVRSRFSRPIKLALQYRVVAPHLTVFDYGCGRGRDVELLKAMQIDASGWDPHFFSHSVRVEADVVNLGYVVNVIENPAERAEVIKEAFDLARECLIVAAQTTATSPSQGVPFADGIRTTRQTFQKYFANEELRRLIEEATGARAYFVERGIFFVFKTDESRLRYTLARERDRKQIPLRRLRSIEMARTWEADSTLLSLVVEIFKGTDILDAHSVSIKNCEKFFGSFENARTAAERILLSIHEKESLAATIRDVPCGKVLPDSLYFHSSALSCMPLLIQSMVNCALSLSGELTDQTVIKISKSGSALSLLRYRDFLNAFHPELMESIRVDLGVKKIVRRSYSGSKNPPILHRKECFVMDNHPSYKRFKALSEAEEALGLLGRPDIGFKQSWDAILSSRSIDLNALVSKTDTVPKG